jgi:hypothetical protein
MMAGKRVRRERRGEEGRGGKSLGWGKLGKRWEERRDRRGGILSEKGG